jgi:fatty acid desaturase
VNIKSKNSLRNITDAIQQEELRLREIFTWLKYQNFIGLFILSFSFIGMISSGYAYITGVFPFWLTLFISAIFASISHEIEHDLIHRLYFRRHPFIHNFMMLVVWLMRPNTVNPWYRRGIHLHHHKVSGTEQDLEERLVGNGIGNKVKRCIVMFDSLLGLIIQRKLFSKEIRSFSFFKVFNAGFPLATAYYTFNYIFILVCVFRLLSQDKLSFYLFDIDLVTLLDTLVVVWLAPNFIRSACLNIVTSSMHYYGGVNNVIQQTQVITSKLFWPLNLFCFNFSQTHSIHHFVVNQPFYLRQMLAKKALKVMKDNGVRFNDFNSFKHANRYSEE